LALDRNVKLGARLAGGRVGGGIVRGIQHQLDDTVAVAKIDEDKAAVIAPGLDPSPQRNLAANVGGANRAAVIGSRPGRQRGILLSFRHYPSQLKVKCWLSSKNTCARRRKKPSLLASVRNRTGRLCHSDFALRALLQVADLHDAARHFVVADYHRDARA